MASTAQTNIQKKVAHRANNEIQEEKKPRGRSGAVF
jgi:hypothetical protein